MQVVSAHSSARVSWSSLPRVERLHEPRGLGRAIGTRLGGWVVGWDSMMPKWPACIVYWKLIGRRLL